MVKHTATSVVTIERYIIEQERQHPEATGELSGILYDIALAAKMIANKVRSAGLADILGEYGAVNVQGESQQKLDVIANEIIIKAMDHGGRLCAMASEEEPEQFLLSHPDMTIPETGKYLSVNDSYEQHWEEPVKALMRRYRGLDGVRQPLNVRYVGSLVADFHRNLLGGGVFAYPANATCPRGKLRLLYEANPLAFIVEQAGGCASDGARRVMELQPAELHERTPLFIGSRREVETAVEMLRAGAPLGVRPVVDRVAAGAGVVAAH